MTQVAKPSRWEAFVSLTWYDSATSFLFRFVSKTAEPLLAAGVIVSAADFLQHGRLMRGNVALENTWVWQRQKRNQAHSQNTENAKKFMRLFRLTI